jgi:hypothetical protein
MTPQELQACNRAANRLADQSYDSSGSVSSAELQEILAESIAIRLLIAEYRALRRPTISRSGGDE